MYFRISRKNRKPNIIKFKMAEVKLLWKQNPTYKTKPTYKMPYNGFMIYEQQASRTVTYSHKVIWYKDIYTYMQIFSNSMVVHAASFIPKLYRVRRRHRRVLLRIRWRICVLYIYIRHTGFCQAADHNDKGVCWAKLLCVFALIRSLSQFYH